MGAGIRNGLESFGDIVAFTVRLYRGIFAFNYVFTQTLLATHPEISVIK